MTNHVLPLCCHVAVSPISQATNNLNLCITASGDGNALVVDVRKRAC